MQACKGCKTTLYCSAQCHEEDWVNGTHAQECQRIEGHRCIHNHYKKGNSPYFADNLEWHCMTNNQPTQLLINDMTTNQRVQPAVSMVTTRSSWETHQHVTQIIYVVSGYGRIEMEAQRTSDLYVPERHSFMLSHGECVIVPSQHRHQIINTAGKEQPLRFISFYVKDSQTSKWIH